MQNVGRSAPTTAGVVEVFCMKVKIAWTDENSTDHFHDVFAAPLILEKANASNAYAAVNDAFEAFSLATIQEICLATKVMFYCEVPDAVGYIKRTIYYKGSQFPRNCLYPYHTCCAHRLHRIFVKVSGADDECQRCSKRWERKNKLSVYSTIDLGMV